MLSHMLLMHACIPIPPLAHVNSIIPDPSLPAIFRLSFVPLFLSTLRVRRYNIRSFPNKDVVVILSIILEC